MTQQEPPKIEFPCEDYLIKVVGNTDPTFKDFVLRVMKSYDPELDESRIKEQPSSKGTYVSYTFFITAESEAQLKALNEELRLDSRVKTVL